MLCTRCRHRRSAYSRRRAPSPGPRRARSPGIPRQGAGVPERRSFASAVQPRAVRSPPGSREAKRQVRRDGGGGLVAVEREARPRVDVQKHQVARRGRDRVTAVHFEAERGGGAADEPRERALVHRVAGQLLVLVIEPAEPGRLAMRAAAGADPVELDQITRDVRLQHGARDPAPGEPPQRSLDLTGRRREHDVAFLRVVDVAALHPDRERPRLGTLARRDDAAGDERYVGLVEDGDHPVTIGVVHRAWGVDVGHAAHLECPETVEHLEPFAHEEDEARPALVDLDDLFRRLELDVKSFRFQVLPCQPQYFGIVGLAARRVGRFAKNSPAHSAHSSPPRPIYDTRPAKASVSASATSSARSTSTTCSMISPYSGAPERASHCRKSRSRPSPAGGVRARTDSATRYMPAVTRSPAAPPISCTRPSAVMTTRSGFSSATRGVTASTVASTGRRAAASTKRTKSASTHHASTVETSIRPPGCRRITSPKLSSEDAVVLTMNSTSRSGKRRRTQSTQGRSCSFTMIARGPMRAAWRFRMTDSISGTPAIGTIGLGIAKPPWRNRLPSPAAMMPPANRALMTRSTPAPGASGSVGRRGSTGSRPAPPRRRARCDACRRRARQPCPEARSRRQRSPSPPRRRARRAHAGRSAGLASCTRSRLNRRGR